MFRFLSDGPLTQPETRALRELPLRFCQFMALRRRPCVRVKCGRPRPCCFCSVPAVSVSIPSAPKQTKTRDACAPGSLLVVVLVLPEKCCDIETLAQISRCFSDRDRRHGSHHGHRRRHGGHGLHRVHRRRHHRSRHRRRHLHVVRARALH